MAAGLKDALGRVPMAADLYDSLRGGHPGHATTWNNWRQTCRLQSKNCARSLRKPGGEANCFFSPRSIIGLSKP